MKLQSKLVSVVLPAIVVPLVALGLLALVLLEQNTEKYAAEKMSAVVLQFDQRFADRIAGAKANILSFADSPQLKSYLQTEDEADRYSFQYPHLLRLFNTYHHAYPDYYEIRVLTPDGYEDVRSTREEIDNVNESEIDNEFFRDLQASDDQPVSRILYNPDNRQYALYVGLKLRFLDPSIDPVIAQPQLLGYLVVTIDLRVLKTFASDTKIGRNGGVSVIYHNGTVLFDPRPGMIGATIPPALLNQLNACASQNDENFFCYKDDQYAFISNQQMPINADSLQSPAQSHSDVLTVAWTPTAELSDESRYLGQIVLLIVISVVVLVSVLIMIALHAFVIKPIRTLRSASLTIGEGDLERSITIDSKDEVGDLGSVFDSMRKNLLALHLNYDHQNKLLQESKDAADSANRAKSDFLANMSHEVRTPLTAVVGFGELLKDDMLPYEQRKKAIESVVTSGKHLQNIVNDILDFSKIEAGKLEIERISVSPYDVLMEVQSLMGVLAREKNLDFDVDFAFPLPAKIETDPTRLKQILLNLSNNAIKFTKKGHVKILVSCDKTNQTMHFRVVDSGIGMTEEQLGKIFEKFTQADTSTTRMFGGTGLGLSISKALSALLGGSLTCTSTTGVGSCFELTINTGALDNVQWLTNSNQVHNVTQTAHQPIHIPSLRGRVLLAEDTPAIQNLIARYIKCAGAHVLCVDNGSQAVTLALNEPFDLILMDLRMPVLDGVCALTQLRKAGYDLPIVMITANTSSDDVALCVNAGANGVLAKPIHFPDFFSTLQRYLTANPIPSAQNVDISDLVSQFVNMLPQRIDLISNAIESNNWDSARDILHILKGSCALFGFPQLTSIANALDTALVDKQLPLARSLLHSLRDCSLSIHSMPS